MLRMKAWNMVTEEPPEGEDRGDSRKEKNIWAKSDGAHWTSRTSYMMRQLHMKE